MAVIESIGSGVLMVADLAEKAYAYHSKFGYWLNRCKRPIRVLVLGESGSGKSQFLSTIQSKRNYIQERTKISDKIKMLLPNGRTVEFVDVPGHQSLKMERDKYTNDISRGKFQGIINVVCFGYQSSSEVKTEDVFQSDGVVKESYLKDNRARELKQLEEWLSKVDNKSNLKWVLTLVNKADIWWENSKEIVDYYELAEYNDKVKELSRVSTIAAVPYCSVITPFCDRPMKLIFGEKEKNVLHRYLCNQLTCLTGEQWPK